MSTLKTGALRGTSGTADSVQLHASNQSVTFPGAVTITGALTSSTTGLGLFSAYAIICDQKSQGTAGGASAADTWEKRDLNTEIVDSSNIVSISSDQFTLGAGTYLVKWRCPAYKAERHQTRLYNATDSSVTQDGFSHYVSSGANAQHDAKGIARFTIAGSKAFEIQHNISNAQSNNGHGLYADTGVEIYSVVEIYKEA